MTEKEILELLKDEYRMASKEANECYLRGNSPCGYWEKQKANILETLIRKIEGKII